MIEQRVCEVFQMGKLIGANNTENFGEKFFVDKAVEYLDDTCII